jgi:hypothetical protein
MKERKMNENFHMKNLCRVKFTKNLLMKNHLAGNRPMGQEAFGAHG